MTPSILIENASARPPHPEEGVTAVGIAQSICWNWFKNFAGDLPFLGIGWSGRLRFEGTEKHKSFCLLPRLLCCTVTFVGFGIRGHYNLRARKKKDLINDHAQWFYTGSWGSGIWATAPLVFVALLLFLDRTAP